MGKRAFLLVLLFVAAAFSKPLENDTAPAVDPSLHPDDNLIVPDLKEASGDGQTRDETPPLPAPVDVSISLGYSDQPAQVQKVTIDEAGIPVIEGVRLPDDPNDTKIWRNARVINNVLVEANGTNDAAHEMFIYRPSSGRAISNDGGFRPSQVDETHSSSLPYPAFYYQSYYKGKSSDLPQLPDTIGTETTDDEESLSKNQTDARGKVRFGDEYKLRPAEAGKQNIHVSSVDGRPVYFVSEDVAKTIHDDRSPFDYEPADVSESSVPTSYSKSFNDNNQQQYQYYYQQPNQYQNQYNKPPQAASDRTQSSPYQQSFYSGEYNHPVPGPVIPAPANSFVVREQVYNAGGSTFKVPIPIPQNQYSTIQNYPYAYPGYQQAPVNPLENLGHKIKEHVQKSKDKLHDFTSPVMEPIVEAGQKISANLGLPERVNQFSEKVAQPQFAVPLALAGGAALALGALGASVALVNSNTTLSGLGLGNRAGGSASNKTLAFFSKIGKRSVDDLEEDDPSRFNVVDTIMASLNAPQRSFLSQLQQSGLDNWKEVPCAKRIFCDVMVQQDDDAVNLMEKRMMTFLGLLDSGLAENLQNLIVDVMEGIRSRDCTSFFCGDQVEEATNIAKSDTNGAPR